MKDLVEKQGAVGAPATEETPARQDFEISAGPFDASYLERPFVFEFARRWASVSPDKPALVRLDVAVTYGDLEARSNQVAKALRSRGIKAGDRVGLVLPRGIETLVALVGVLKAGAAYVPLDSHSPVDRIRLCLEDAEPALVVAESPDVAMGTPFEALFVSLEQLLVEASACDPAPIASSELGLLETDLAYVIFTSGTTGRPKGVPISHRALGNFVRGDQATCIKVESEDRVLQAFSPASDGHHEEIWPTLMAGGTLVVATTDDVHSGPELAALLNRHSVTIVSCAPTLLSMVEDDVPSLRRVLFGAERCSPEIVRRWWRPGREIVNTYGPTEATVGATYASCEPGKPITIGRPLPNYSCYVLDEHLEPVPAGAEGELCLAGVGVSAGYLGNAAQRNDRFVDNPYVHAEGDNPTLYRTGDRVRLAPDGAIEWLGRIDSQVKIRGHRIELSEIEGHLVGHPAVRAAVAVAREAGDHEARLAALLVLRADEPFDASGYFADLHSALPAYMVPQCLERVDRIPMLPSGKVDRRQCQELSGEAIRIEREILPPSTDTERMVLGIWATLFPESEISCADDFFRDLGGYSLLASRFISVLRGEHGFPDVSVLDIYENPTVRSFASALDAHERPAQATIEFHKVPRSRYLGALAAQAAGIVVLYGFQGLFWLGPLIAAIYFSNNGFSDFHSLLLGLALHAASVPVMLAMAVAAKWAIVGRFKPGRYPLWGFQFLRWWFVHRILATAPVGYLTGTSMAGAYYRLLGAKVGRNVCFESVEMDCPDLVEIGNDCSFENSSWIHAAEVAHGELILRRVHIANGCSIGVRSGVCGGATLEEGASLRDLTCATPGMTVPKGEEWVGSPAHKSSKPLLPPYDPSQQPSFARRLPFTIATVLLVLVMTVMDSIPFMTVAWMLYNYSETLTDYLIGEPICAMALVLIAGAQALLVKWLVLGRLRPGTYPFPGATWLRKWFAEKHLEAVGALIVPIYDSLFTRHWCRALGMKCGPRCEIALPRRMPYDLVEMGEESFLASEVSIGRPIRRNGTLKLEPTVIGKRTFLGNDSVVPQGLKVPDEFLLGVLSVCPQNDEMGEGRGQAWLGSPAFQMPTRQIHDQFDVQRTYKPTKKLYVQRLVHETVRLFLPSLCSLIVAALIIEGFVFVWNETSLPIATLVSPVIYLGGTFVGGVLCLIAKLVLVGRYKPTVQPLWSQYVWKTETYSAILHDFGTPFFIGEMVGTPFLSSVMRFLGAKVGKRTFINTTDFTETDLIRIGDDVAINSNAPLQAHLFEDRVIKVGRIWIGDRCTVGNYSVILCESELKADAHVGHLSLVMKGETIPSHTIWSGSPAQAALGWTGDDEPERPAQPRLVG